MSAQMKPNTKFTEPTSKIKPSASNSFIDLTHMAVGDKLPKNCIEIITSLGSEVNITFSTYSVRKDLELKGHTYMKFTGEYSGSSNKHILIFLMLYNTNNELIAYNDDIRIRSDFHGYRPFSSSVCIPSDECISKAVIRLVYDPTFV